MSPEQVSILTNLVALVKMLSSWPMLTLIFALIIGPWIISLMLAESYRRRFETVVDMYESNVRLVEKYEKLATDLKDVVMVNTQVNSALAESIKTNQFCPIVREKGGTG